MNIKFLVCLVKGHKFSSFYPSSLCADSPYHSGVKCWRCNKERFSLKHLGAIIKATKDHMHDCYRLKIFNVGHENIDNKYSKIPLGSTL